MKPKRYSMEHVKSYAHRARQFIEVEGRAVLIWWSLTDSEFLILAADGKAGRLLQAGLDTTRLSCHVGVFDSRSSRTEIQAALECHAAGHLQGFG